MFNNFQDIFHQNNTEKNPKKVSISGRELVIGSYNAHDINSSNITPKVNLLKDCGNSFHIEPLMFTNMLPNIIDGNVLDPKIEFCFSTLIENPAIITNKYSPVRHSGVNEKRIETILSKQLGEDKFNELKGLFYKSDIENQLNRTKEDKLDRGSFRVISVYEIAPIEHKKQKKPKHYLNVILLDPFHLLIPSGVYDESNNYIEKEKAHLQTYTLHKNNFRHVHECFKFKYV